MVNNSGVLNNVLAHYLAIISFFLALFCCFFVFVFFGHFEGNFKQFLPILSNLQVHFIELAFRHSGACLPLLFNAVEENLRGMNERMNDTHSGFFILDEASYIQCKTENGIKTHKNCPICVYKLDFLKKI